MDRARFDCFARSVAGATSRRGALRVLAGGALGLAGMTAASDALAGCGSDGDECATNKNCCGGLKCSAKKGDGKVGKCRYKNGKGCGTKNDFCKQNKDCCGGFLCRSRKCVRKNKA